MKGSRGLSRISLPPVTQPSLLSADSRRLECCMFLLWTCHVGMLGQVGMLGPYLLGLFFGVTFLACPQGSLARVYLSPFCREKQQSWEVEECRMPLDDPRVTRATKFIRIQVQSTLLLCKPLGTTGGFSHLERVV